LVSSSLRPFPLHLAVDFDLPAGAAAVDDVLHVVREAAAEVLAFVDRADLHVGEHVHDGRRVPLFDDDLDAVGQLVHEHPRAVGLRRVGGLRCNRRARRDRRGSLGRSLGGHGEERERGEGRDER
jgi:hypothetical protein